MRKQSLFHTLAFAALAGIIGFSVASCHDDTLTPEEQAEKEQQEAAEKAEKASKFWDVVGPLTSLYDHSAPYEDLTFEPTIGSPDESDPQTRIVATNSSSAAAERFADIIGVTEGIDESTQSYTFDDPDVGTLTYTKVSDGTAWATVDVSIKQLPHLTRIIYRSASQGNTNGSFEGTAYYRFGDVIRRPYTSVKPNTTGSTQYEYWVCVRPSFGIEGKGDSHWVTLSSPPKENTFSYHSDTNNKNYLLPDNLGTSKEHMQNLAEMFFAIAFPEEWESNVKQYSGTGLFGGPTGLPIFKDFNVKNIDYHNQHFWKRVQLAWRELGICSYLFGAELADEAIDAYNNGLYLLHNKCSWNTFWSNGPTLYFARYQPGTEKTSNFHNVSYLSTQEDLIHKNQPSEDIDFDISQMPLSYIENQPFFGDTRHLHIFRFATGKDLNGGKYDPKLPIRDGGFEDFYTYNNFYDLVDLFQEPEKAKPLGTYLSNDDPAKQRITEFSGTPHYKFGDVYNDAEGSKWFCIYSSGARNVDRSPYSYLISFDNIKVSGDKRRATNLAPRDAVIRCSHVLAIWFTQENLRASGSAAWRRTIDNIQNNIDISIKKLFRMRWAESDGRYNTTSFCVAYDGLTENAQDLIRFNLNAYDYQPNNNHEDVWEHYPAEAVADALPRGFSGRNILLQDIADQSLVAKYAEDMQARRSYFNETDAQYPRTQADKRALDVTNYFYNSATWRDRTYPTSMWNEPILFFRVTKVYDRGDLDYATKTVDDIVLEPAQLITWYNNEEENPGVEYNGNYWLDLKPTIDTFAELFNNLHFENKNYVLKWQTDWQKKTF